MLARTHSGRQVWGVFPLLGGDIKPWEGFFDSAGLGVWPHLVEVLEGIGQAEPQAVGDLLVGHLEDHPGVPLGEDAGDGGGMSIRHPPPRQPKSTEPLCNRNRPRLGTRDTFFQRYGAKGAPKAAAACAGGQQRPT